jgi:1-deoxy-D-xylulose-5-phosphate reductoisomerase
MKKNLAILGSTGSIGIQALEVVSAHPDLFRVAALTAYRNAGLLIAQSKVFLPETVVIGDESLYQQVSDELKGWPVQVLAGNEAVLSVAGDSSSDLILAAIVGFAGLLPVVEALKAGKVVALANKEALVVAGGYITSLARKHQATIIPVDSEHSAILQCLAGESQNAIEKIILTASGGPFADRPESFLEQVTVQEALNHPNWSMGAKITIDSATLMNKGFEVIEAGWLFDLRPEQIEVVIHPQSIIHSLVMFRDGSLKAQLGIPDMRIPIQYAFSYPQRIPTVFERFSFDQYPLFTFGKPDHTKFPNLQLAYDVMKKGGNFPCVLNAANEAAVSLFLQGRIGFLDIAGINEAVLERTGFIESPEIEMLFECDNASRTLAFQIAAK